MFSTRSVPDEAVNLIPAGDRHAPYVEGEDGSIIVAGQHALYVIKDGELAASGMWYEVQYATWKAQSRELTVIWTEPDWDPVLVVTRDENPEKFMRVLTSRVDRALVVSRQQVTPSGALLTATVRRRVDNALFSTVMCQGYLPPEEEILARRLEDEVRAEVGLGTVGDGAR